MKHAISLTALLCILLIIPAAFSQEPAKKRAAQTRGLQSESAVTQGLSWLARHQNPDGSWGAAAFQDQCQKSTCDGAGDDYYDIGLTGLALLAFTGAGYTPDSKQTYSNIRFGDVVSRAADQLISLQLSDGAFGAIKAGYKFNYNQTVATYALADIYALTGRDDYKEPLARAVKYLVQSQNPGQAWRYHPRDGSSDSSVTGWAFMALKTADSAGIEVPPEAFDGIRSFFNKVTDPQFGKVGYTTRGSVALMGHEDPQKTVVQPSLTAIGVLVRLLAEKGASGPVIDKGVKIIRASPPKWSSDNAGIIDYYYWFYGSACLYKYDGAQGPIWQQWNKTVRSVLSSSQKTSKNPCACGSWDPLDRWSAEASRVYTTAINLLTLETQNRLGK